MVIVTSNQPLIAHYEHGEDSIILLLRSYSWYDLGTTEILHVPDKIACHTRRPRDPTSQDRAGGIVAARLAHVCARR